MPKNVLTAEEEAAITPGLTGPNPSTLPNASLDDPGSFGGDRTLDQNRYGYENPAMAARAWMQENGMDPNAANPIIQRMLRAASGAARQYDLSTNLEHDGGSGFMDFLGSYMNNRNTPGAGAIFSKDEIDQMIAKAMQSAAMHGERGAADNPWSAYFSNFAEIDPNTGQGYAATPTDQANVMKAVIGGAYQDVSNPFAMQAQQNMINRESANWQTDMLTPGRRGQDQVGSFLLWLLSNGGVPGQGAS